MVTSFAGRADDMKGGGAEESGVDVYVICVRMSAWCHRRCEKWRKNCDRRVGNTDVVQE